MSFRRLDGVSTISGDVTGADDRLNELGRRLHEVASKIGEPAETAAVMRARFDDVARQMRAIEIGLRAEIATRIAEENGLGDQLAELEARLAAGDPPEMRPVDEVVAELRAAFQ